MQLESYLKINNLTPAPWAASHGISVATLNRYLRKVGRADVLFLLRIEKACNEQVTVKELIERYKTQLAE